MTEHQTGTILPLSECKPGWLVKFAYDEKPGRVEAYGGRGGVSIRNTNGHWLSPQLPVTLISALPGWMPIEEGDPRNCRNVMVYWVGGKIDVIGGGWFKMPTEVMGALWWRDASADAPAQAPDLAARVAELRDTDMRTVLDAIAGVSARVEELLEQFSRHFHMTDPREDRTTTQHQPVEVGDWPKPVFVGWDLGEPGGDKTVKWPVPYPAPGFTTSRKPADSAPGVMTDDEIVAAAWRESPTRNGFGPALLRLARANIRAQLAAMKLDRFDGDPGAHMVINHIIAALKAHKEGV